MITDLTKSSAEQILTLVNETNLSALDFTHIEFGTPVALENDPDNCNVALDVISRPNGGYKGIVGVKYNRLDLSGFTQYGEPVLELPPNNSTLTDVVEAFNVLYDANLSAEDDIASNVVIPEIDYADTEMTLTASDDSLAYHGTVTINVRWQSTELSETITNTLLHGLKYPLAELNGAIEFMTPTGSASYASSASIIDDSLYVYGGISANGSYSSSLRRYDFLTNSWSTLSSDIGRGAHASAVIDNLLYVFGNGRVPHNTYSIYDPSTDSWTAGTTTMPIDAYYHSAVAVGRSIYILGSISALGRICEFNVDSGTFTLLPTHLAALNSRGVTHYKGKLYILGGRSGSTAYNVLECYDIATGTVSSMAPAPRALCFIDLVSVGDYLYAFGGVGGNSTAYDSLLRYDPATNTWYDYGDIGIGFRAHYNMVAYNDELYLFNGRAGSTSSTSQNSFVKIS